MGSKSEQADSFSSELSIAKKYYLVGVYEKSPLMKNIVHYINLDTVGGVEVLFADFIKMSTNELFSHNVFLMTDRIHPNIHDSIVNKIMAMYRVKYFHRLKIPKMPCSLRLWNFNRLLGEVRPNLVMFWNTMDLRMPKEFSFGRKFSFVFYDHGTSWYQKRLPRTRYFLSLMNKTLCCSHASRRILELYHQHNGPIEVLLNPLRPGFSSLAIRPKTLPSDRPLRVGVAGRLVNYKGMSLALHTIAALKKRGIDAELYIAGTGKEKKKLEKIARDLNIEKQTFFLGLILQMPEYYQQIDVFLCPSIRESFGLVSLEAMAGGCPVVCSLVDGLPEIVTQKKTGICVAPLLPLTEYPHLGGSFDKLPEYVYDPVSDNIKEPCIVDPEQFAGAIEEITEDPLRYETMSQSCLNDAKSRFSFSRYLSSLEKTIGEVM